MNIEVFSFFYPHLYQTPNKHLMESSASSQAQPATENTLITSLSANKTKCLNLQADVLHNEIEIHNP